MEIVRSGKIKIVRVIARLNIGGPAIHTILLSKGLNNDGYKDILIAGLPSESEGDMTGLARSNGIEPVLISTLGRDISLGNDFKSLFRLHSIIKKEMPDIVHTHTAKAGTLGRLAAILAGVPIRIHTFHGHVLSGYFSPFKTKLFRLIEKILSYFTDKVIVVSEDVRHEVVDKLKVVSKDKCIVVNLGLELEPFLQNNTLAGSFRKEISMDREALLVGIIGRLVPIKNHKMFLDVVKRIKDIVPDIKIKFLIVGDGESRQQLEEYAKRLNLSGCVIFTGWVKDLPPLYADLDVVALTSLNEGTPVCLIEALASARAVISTNVGGVKDIIVDGENGFLVNTGDVEKFSERLLELLKDPEKRRQFGMRGRALVRGRYSSDRLVRDIENLYAECLKK